MLRGAKSWDEMRAELPLDVQQRLDERAKDRAKARLRNEREADAPPPKDAKPAA